MAYKNSLKNIQTEARLGESARQPVCIVAFLCRTAFTKCKLHVGVAFANCCGCDVWLSRPDLPSWTPANLSRVPALPSVSLAGVTLNRSVSNKLCEWWTFYEVSVAFSDYGINTVTLHCCCSLKNLFYVRFCWDVYKWHVHLHLGQHLCHPHISLSLICF